MYKTNSTLPGGVQNVLPPHAQTIYRESFNTAWEKYTKPGDRRSGSREEVAHKVAWSAVKQKYRKDADDDWVTKD